jgi:hypothetical protein
VVKNLKQKKKVLYLLKILNKMGDWLKHNFSRKRDQKLKDLLNLDESI